MKINLILEKDGTISSWISYPFDEKKPHVEIDNPRTIFLGVDKFVDGKIVRDKEKRAALIKRQKARLRIDELKQNLSDSDYKLFKYLEGEIPEEEYQQIKKLRHDWRYEINRLEEEFK